jgi:hypothetical protein
MGKRITSVVTCILLLSINPSAQAATVKGATGQVLKTSSTLVKSGAKIIVSGSKFDETIGIYLGYCVVPEKGALPSPCDGGVNKEGIGGASFWISSNPPPYAVGLTKEFLPGGRFKETIKVSKMIGKFDCTKVKCAITVRADHLRGEDRSSDLFIPITIKK